MGRFRGDGQMKADGYGHTNMHTGDRVKKRKGDGCMEQREIDTDIERKTERNKEKRQLETKDRQKGKERKTGRERQRETKRQVERDRDTEERGQRHMGQKKT